MQLKRCRIRINLKHLIILRRFNTTKEHKRCTEECEEKTNKMKEHDEKLEAITKQRHEKEEKIKEDIA